MFCRLATVAVASASLTSIDEQIAAWGARAPPAFGRAMRSEFDMDPLYVNVNQGSYGCTPTKVRHVTEALVRETEWNPDLWFRFNISGDGDSHMTAMLARTRALVASYIGANVEDTVLVDNASHGIAAVLRSISANLPAGQRGVLYLDLAYGEVKAALAFVGGVAPYNDTASRDNDHELFEVATEHLFPGVTDDALVGAVAAALDAAGGRVGFAVFSHVVSTPGLVLPVARLAALCRARGVRVLIDGAHAPGMLPLRMHEIDADYYVGNGHKHLFSSRGAAVLWAHPRAQRGLYPLVIDSGGLGTDFERAFAYQGTTDDNTRYIAVRAALAWREWAGGDAAIMDHNHELALAACAALADMWGTEVLAPEMTAALCNVRVPCAPAGCPDGFSLKLYRAHNFYAPIFRFAGADYVRLTAQIYNELADFAYVGEKVLESLGIETALTERA